MSKGTVIVTGGGRGIGFAIAQKLAEQGYGLCLVDIMAEILEEAKASLPGGTECMTLVGDVSDWDSVEEMVKTADQEMGPIYGLVNNAGITRDGLIMRMSPESWRQVIDVNLNGTFYFTKAVAPLMMRQKIGRIVNIASVVGISGNAGQANYAASKAGVIAMTKSVAKELGGRSITANAIAPGFIATEMTDKLPEQVKADWLKSIPLKRLGTSLWSLTAAW